MEATSPIIGYKISQKISQEGQFLSCKIVTFKFLIFTKNHLLQLSFIFVLSCVVHRYLVEMCTKAITLWWIIMSTSWKRFHMYNVPWHLNIRSNISYSSFYFLSINVIKKNSDTHRSINNVFWYLCDLSY